MEGNTDSKGKTRKPKCKLIGENGNIFCLLSIASETLEKANMKKEAKKMFDRVMNSQSYSESLDIISEYVGVE